MINLTRLLPGAVILLSLLLSCGGDTVEDRIRKIISQAEESAETRNVRKMRSFISEQYEDEKGHTKDDIAGLLRYHFFRNESVHLLTRVHAVSARGEKEADAVIFVAMAGFPIPTVTELAAVRADLYRFDLEFSEEDDGLRVIRGRWRPAVVDDFKPSSSTSD